MKIDDIELHDALLKKLQVNYVEKTAAIDIEFYETEQSSTRLGATIAFEKVANISHISDFNRLEINASAGNINYWVPAKNKGVTYIYLVDGCIAIDASIVSIKMVKV